MDMMMLWTKTIGQLKTPGVKTGEKMDISELEEELAAAVSTATLLLLKSLSKYYSIYFLKKKLLYFIK